MRRITRRGFLGTSLAGAAVAMSPPAGLFAAEEAGEKGAEKPGGKMRFGLVTYQWGKDLDLPKLIAVCTEAKVHGVELRTTHKHGVERTLTAAERKEVKKRFDDSPVTNVGIGSNERFDDPDPAKLKAAIEATNQFVSLSRDTGGSGVKVKPNSFHKGVPREKTIEQIGRSLNVVGKFAAEYGQEIRLEVHGECAELPIMKQIMDHVDQKNVGVCWNCNPKTDLAGGGLEHNFNLVKDRFGATAHLRQLDRSKYPSAEFIKLLVKMDYAGWCLLEAHGKRPSKRKRAERLTGQRERFEKMVAAARVALKV